MTIIRYTVVLEPAPDPLGIPPDRRLKACLKSMLRRFRMRAVSVSEQQLPTRTRAKRTDEEP